jgi:hypothetical protein
MSPATLPPWTVIWIPGIERRKSSPQRCGLLWILYCGYNLVQPFGYIEFRVGDERLALIIPALLSSEAGEPGELMWSTLVEKKERM